MEKPPKNVTVVVLGDIGRSPRMQYHAMSLARTGNIVDIIAYGETEPMVEVKAEPLIFYHYLLSPPKLPIKLVNYAFKTVWQALNLLFLLLITRRPDVLLVQNPPAIPSLIVCWLYCKLVGAKFVIDWHNYAFTLMALRVGKRSMLVNITHKVEQSFGRLADANFCVTNAMRNDLKQGWGIDAITLYDRPPSMFKPISLEEKHEFLKSLAQKYKDLLDEDGYSLFTVETSEGINLKQNRPGLIVSSTSWTEDEDFVILFDALQAYEDQCDNNNIRRLPKLICIITGKGPLKAHYCKKIEQREWKNIKVFTPWLESREYPLMLASADLGVSLHFSSSGLDLPMKVVDMFGCELPVCAYNYECLYELVKNGENGYTFCTSKELTDHIQNWFEDFPDNERQKEIEAKFKRQLRAFQIVRWDQNWNNVAAKVFE